MNKKGEVDGYAVFVFSMCLLFCVFIFILFSFSIVGYNEYAIEKEFGQIIGDFREPGITYVGFGTLIRVNNQIRNYDIEIDGFSKDKQQVMLDIIVNLKIKNEFVKEFILNYKDEETYNTYLENKVQDEVKSILSKYEAEYALENRELLANELTERLRQVKEIEYFEFNDVVIDNIEYSPEFRAILEDSARVEIEREIIMKERQNNVELKKNIEELNINSYLKYKIANNYKGESLFLGGDFMKVN